MTTHLDDELLAQWAFEQSQPDERATGHLRSCPACQASLDELRELAATVDDLPELENPPREVWQRITAELGLSVPVDSVVRPERRTDGWSRRAVVLAASVAAIVGIGVGIGGTLLLRGGDDVPAAAPETVIKLAPLNGKTGDGTAGLVQAATGPQLKVSASGLSAASGYYEVWLINEDGKRMVSLGVLAAGHDGTFQLPSDLPAQGYRIVDVSLEPDDGNPAHSLDSVIRGTLPA
ncbi:hypothetical protein Kfla_4446 [Kribbella flavida DSM 17836]|uniref:Regulator of SigK n=1 Tax=Kribbella flavida (strain DSM 17836 / JCM 10339 / NBRC 14399) TaxID=479435 RepID=D2PWK8_KRIFD|nr:anti-sigma factor [Kribbella flavida]ADB33477.1 hypothetical protein Kfla_4446 [Kribbella flavida DSM 17836]